ncbi:MAG: DUF3822 family protein [Bacteroides sp.]|nr:DUF3822 family protein [Bacteroides sp.]
MAIGTFSIESLSIRLGTDGFSFSTLRGDRNESPSIEHFSVDDSLPITANLKRVLAETNFAKQSYQKVHVFIDTPRYTLVPLELFEDEQAELLFHHNFSPVAGESVCYDIVRRVNVVCIYGMDRSLSTFLHETFPQASLHTQASAHLSYFAHKSHQSNRRKLYAVLSARATEIYCMDRGKLLLNNTFACKHTDDRLYFLLYSWKQLEMDQEQDELHLMGALPQREELMRKLQTFVRHVFVIPNASAPYIYLCE